MSNIAWVQRVDMAPPAGTISLGVPARPADESVIVWTRMIQNQGRRCPRLLSPLAQLVIAREFEVRRSELTCGAHSSKMMTKAATSAADEVILDLEDACAVSRKIEARKSVVQGPEQPRLRRQDPGLPSQRGANPVLLPRPHRRGGDGGPEPGCGGRAEGRSSPRTSCSSDPPAHADRGEHRAAHRPGSASRALIESAKGLLHAEAIAACTPRMASLIFGIADYAGDIGAKELTRDQFSVYHCPKAHIIASARAAGIAIIDNVTLHFRDLDQVKADAVAGANMGFDGKWAIHPPTSTSSTRHIPPESATEVTRALRDPGGVCPGRYRRRGWERSSSAMRWSMLRASGWSGSGSRWLARRG